MRNSANVFFAVRVDGHFDAVHVRAACRIAPGVPLAVATEQQSEFELTAVDGTMVGFWSPPYASGVEIAGYHLHFLTDDRTAGGHVLDGRGRALRVRVQEESDVHLALPTPPRSAPPTSPTIPLLTSTRPSTEMEAERRHGSGALT